MDAISEFPSPPARLPKYIREYFSYGGLAELVYDYQDDKNGTGRFIHWSKEIMEVCERKFDQKILRGPYGKHIVAQLKEVINTQMNVAGNLNIEYFFAKRLFQKTSAGKHLLVVGSQEPWIEMTLIKAGVQHVTTLDYDKIHCDHPKISTITPKLFAEAFLSDALPQYDAVVSFSSVEHSGLGRYGDALNPWGDIIAMARMWCVLKPGNTFGQDFIINTLFEKYPRWSRPGGCSNWPWHHPVQPGQDLR